MRTSPSSTPNVIYKAFYTVYQALFGADAPETTEQETSLPASIIVDMAGAEHGAGVGSLIPRPAKPRQKTSLLDVLSVIIRMDVLSVQALKTLRQVSHA